MAVCSSSRIVNDNYKRTNSIPINDVSKLAHLLVVPPPPVPHHVEHNAALERLPEPLRQAGGAAYSFEVVGVHMNHWGAGDLRDANWFRS